MTTEKTEPKRGPGRPALPEEDRLIVRSVRLTSAQWETIDANGMNWLRKLIDLAKTVP